MSGELREVVNYPHWMWIVGVLVLSATLVWIGVWVIRWLRSSRGVEEDQVTLIPLDEKRRQRYLMRLRDVYSPRILMNAVFTWRSPVF